MESKVNSFDPSCSDTIPDIDTYFGEFRPFSNVYDIFTINIS